MVETLEQGQVFNMAMAKNWSIRALLDKDAELALNDHHIRRVHILQMVETEISAYLTKDADDMRCEFIRRRLNKALSTYNRQSRFGNRKAINVLISALYEYRQFIMNMLKKYGFEQPTRDDPRFALGRGG